MYPPSVSASSLGKRRVSRPFQVDLHLEAALELNEQGCDDRRHLFRDLLVVPLLQREPLPLEIEESLGEFRRGFDREVPVDRVVLTGELAADLAQLLQLLVVLLLERPERLGLFVGHLE